jgi:hypothetical protein
MAKPVSISVREISAAAKGSVSRALEKHNAAFPVKPGGPIGYFPRPWIFGFILDQDLLEKTALGNAQLLASDVHADIARSMSSVQAGKPGVVIGGGHIICGFFPAAEIEMIEE